MTKEPEPMRRLYVPIPQASVTKLQVIAQREYREWQQQAGYLLQRAIDAEYEKGTK